MLRFSSMTVLDGITHSSLLSAPPASAQLPTSSSPRRYSNMIIRLLNGDTAPSTLSVRHLYLDVSTDDKAPAFTRCSLDAYSTFWSTETS